ncbi:oxygen-independent coproporphyrinogen-III oxidase-like protein [Clostridium acetireducens DSM 10703]|jgi:histone acetyltransferase (RNA polymerase elongator complex component)|uniref:Oxygen-independent coproporphyrinogen-III oxidase-like protein n=1 Tax=Clostridium acetireducens DSM 10703 TaxID=1121290 RepID=A0A1E8F214_9CLOT|nr:radical SAM protein [Clostridium acetireducens]OFI07696.1 oxygen-independent coproporphyrinogen-III oxidase-like protein [Clostridium acetireducens DSM 10703]
MGKTHYIIPIFVPHEGCPHNCVFCNQNSITGNENKVDKYYTKNIIEEYLDTIKNKDATIEVSFFGGTFTAIDINRQKELLSVAKEYKDKGYVDYIHMSTRPDYINHEILQNLKDYSVDIIELGIQSLDEEVLLKSGRGHTIEDVEIASNLIKKYGFTLGHQIMLGLPGDNFKKDIETAKKVIKIKPNICRIYPALVVKNTPMEDMYYNNLYTPYSLKKAIEITKIVYQMFLANNIKVIRIGLQPTEEINIGKDLVAGPFHPAFRELVEGSIINDVVKEKIKEEFTKSEHVILEVNPKDISKLYANKKEFFNEVKKELVLKNIKVIQKNHVDKFNIIIKDENKFVNIDIYDYTKSKYIKGYSKAL